MADLLKYLIVDDDEIDRLAIECEADKFPFLKKITACSHPLQAIELINQHPPDILFVDIEMPDISGMELVKRCQNKSMVPVFITSHPEFAIDSYDVDAFDYLLKPVVADRFARCAHRLKDFFGLRDKAFAFEQEQQLDSIVIKQGYEKYRIRLTDILYLEAMKDYTRVMVAGKQYLVLATLGSMIEKLPPEKFIRVHRSFVVNVDKIEDVKGNRLSVAKAVIPIGKLYKTVLQGRF